MPVTEYKFLRANFLLELDYLSNMGSKVFIYPFIGRSRVVIYSFGTIYAMLLITSAQLFGSLCLTGFKDWFEIINVAPNLGVVLMAVLKYTKIHSNQKVYDEIFTHFRDKFWEGVFNTDGHKKIVTKYTSFTKFVLRFVVYYSLPLVIIVNSFPRLIMFYENDVNGKESVYLYPFDGWYPFNKVKFYYVAYFWESLMTAVVIGIYTFTNMIHGSYTVFICMELKVLGNSMENLISSKDVDKIKKGINVRKTHADIKNRLRNIIIRHQFVTHIARELDNVLGDSMLLNYVFGAVFICLTVFTATVVDDLYKTLRYFSMFCSLMVEIFFQCIIGQVLSDHSEQLTESIYSADWPNADKESKTMLLIFLAGTQRPLQFTANGYLAMNLDSFSGICKLSYQLFNLLLTMYS
uniref:Odorant receptor n=2 Tax=Heortia vitessoides TaxID=1557813 RepID=A0A978W709_9NEOP|nr:odorant receptor 5 [Heortia vitessoides]